MHLTASGQLIASQAEHTQQKVEYLPVLGESLPVGKA